MELGQQCWNIHNTFLVFLYNFGSNYYYEQRLLSAYFRRPHQGFIFPELFVQIQYLHFQIY